MSNAEISWNGLGPDGMKRQVNVRREAGTWIFRSREKRFDDWTVDEAPPLEDWLELLDGIRRRIGRGLLKIEEERNVTREIRRRFPQADIPA